ncbi:sugar nucleotide-binding protein [Pseudodesulfovibrio sp. JC047]|uniref:SDR family oxidoreductase n=1 Tax=Pseudodesulfovibrio sp. JC047 TaxID=2683199 RepID=UPI0013D7E076|nr:SDR family oxidoreductase [Pseudodesulfovibrio sp. JC047]NDV20642.1 sugar nucleotide-binding protein [Pseudodesulfovibrio sp. JC047]
MTHHTPTILITGVSGMLGLNLALMLRETCRVIGTFMTHPVHLSGVVCRPMNLADPVSIALTIEATHPDIVIHCAAMTSVDRCETEPDTAMQLNAHATGLVARASASVSARLVVISTDAVFDGIHGGYTEQDRPEPINMYGRSKLQGEQLARDAHPDPLILRTTIFGLTGRPGHGLARWILDNGKTGTPFTGFTDAIFAPVLVNTLGDIIMRCLDTGLTGTYHAASTDSISKYDFARALMHQWGYAPRLVMPGSLDNIPFTAPRPANSALNGSRLSTLLGTETTVQADIRRMHDLARSGLGTTITNALHA